MLNNVLTEKVSSHRVQYAVLSSTIAKKDLGMLISDDLKGATRVDRQLGKQTEFFGSITSEITSNKEALMPLYRAGVRFYSSEPL